MRTQEHCEEIEGFVGFVTTCPACGTKCECRYVGDHLQWWPTAEHCIHFEGMYEGGGRPVGSFVHFGPSSFDEVQRQAAKPAVVLFDVEL